MKILVTDKIVDEGIAILRGKGYEVDTRYGRSFLPQCLYTMRLSFAAPLA